MKKQLLLVFTLPFAISVAYAQGLTSNIVSDPFSFCDTPKPKCKGCPLEGEWDRLCQEKAQKYPQFNPAPTPAQQAYINQNEANTKKYIPTTAIPTPAPVPVPATQPLQPTTNIVSPPVRQDPVFRTPNSNIINTGGTLNLS